jgi:VanZ family protein
MLEMPRIRRLAWIVLIGYALLLATATHLPPSRVPQTGIGDKYAHFTAYLILGALLCTALATTRLSDLGIVACSISIALAFAAIDEWTQPLVGRMCSLADWFADAGGASVAVLGFLLIRSARSVAAARGQG